MYQRKVFSCGDSYEKDILNPADELVALAVVLTIDCASESNSNSASNN